MAPDRWQRIRSILEQAPDGDGEAPDAVSEDAVSEETWDDDRGLMRALSGFVAARQAADHSAAADAENQAIATSDDEGCEPGADKHIGPYRILRRIAQGGMGTVFLAARDDDAFKRQVAIKVIQAGLGSQAVAQRFHSERSILANLDHPNIARLFDGGTSADGRPYFVMEYVDGSPIDVYCDHHRLTIDARLVLFRKVCSAVSFAHQNLVVHRDLKPGNILITTDGEPKLLDFGIAKVLQPETFGLSAEKTQTGLRPMTPRYASPEQVRGEPIGTASDAYSLGVLLYELLIGRSPYRLESGLPHEVEWAICEQEATPPSSELSRTHPLSGITDIAEQRGSRPGDLIRRLRGDLDHILGRVLRKDPHERYGSVEQLSQDLKRHLGNLPVDARRGSVTYRAGKLARRHRFAVAVLAAVSTMAILFILALGEQNRRLELEQQRSDRSLKFLVDVFRASEPGTVRGEALTAKRILDTGAQRVVDELEGQPAVQATLMDAIGQVYLSLGLYEQAVPLLEGALERRRKILGTTHIEVASTLQHLAELRYENGEYQASEALFREALAVRRELLGNNHELVADSLDGLATVLRWSGKLHGSEGIHNEALEIRRRTLGPSHPKVAQSLDSLASLYYRRGDYDQAEALFHHAVAILRQALGDDDPMMVMTYKNIGVVLAKRGDLDSALEIFTEAVALLRQSLGPDHPWVAQLLQNLAASWLFKGDLRPAEDAIREAITIQEASLDPQHPDLIRCLTSLGDIHLQKGELDDAENVLNKALSKARARLGERNMITAAILRNLASVRLEQGRLESAESFFLQSMETVREIHHDHHVSIADPLLGLGRLAMARQEPITAEPLLRRAVELRRLAFSEDHWQLLQAEGALGASLVALDRFDEAQPLLERYYSEFKRQFGEDHARTVDAWQKLSELYDAWGRPASFF